MNLLQVLHLYFNKMLAFFVQDYVLHSLKSQNMRLFMDSCLHFYTFETLQSLRTTVLDPSGELVTGTPSVLLKCLNFCIMKLEKIDGVQLGSLLEQQYGAL